MTAPTNRAQRILHFIAGCKTPATLAQIIAAAEPNGEYRKFSTVVSAQLCGMVNDGKLTRTGKNKAFVYTATATTLLDGRKFDRNGVLIAAPKRTRAKVERKPAAKATAAAKPAHRVTDAQRFRIPAAAPKPPRHKSDRETVEEFVKRGGRIEQLQHGESSRPIYEAARDLNAMTMRKRLAEIADNDDTSDDQLAVA